MIRRTRILVVAAVSAAVLMVGPLAGSVAAHDLDLPGGTACSFALGIDVMGVGPGAVWREWQDADGDVVRTLSAGTGAALTYTNDDTGATLSMPWNGSVTNTVINPDGTQTVRITGHTLLILFPSDTPAGPSTTLWTGRVTFTIDAYGNYTVVRTAGRALDICAALG